MIHVPISQMEKLRPREDTAFPGPCSKYQTCSRAGCKGSSPCASQAPSSPSEAPSPAGGDWLPPVPSHAWAVQAASCTHQSRRPLSASAAGCQRFHPPAWEKTPRGHVRETVISGQASAEHAGELAETSARSWGYGCPSEAPRAAPGAGGGGRCIPQTGQGNN